MHRSTVSRLALTAGAFATLLGASALLAPSAEALKYAKREHNIQADRSLPVWVPAKIETQPEEEFNVVGADVMDEMTLGWVRMMRKAYPRLSVTIEARASGSGGPALTNGIAHAAPVGRELLPAEEAGFVAKFGYKPTAIRVATGSAGSLGKTAASIIMVDRENPVRCLSLTQLDAIYSRTRLRSGSDITGAASPSLARTPQPSRPRSPHFKAPSTVSVWLMAQ